MAAVMVSANTATPAHSSAGDHRSESGFRPQIRRLHADGPFECYTVSQPLLPIGDSWVTPVPANIDQLGTGMLNLQNMKPSARPRQSTPVELAKEMLRRDDVENYDSPEAVEESLVSDLEACGVEVSPGDATTIGEICQEWFASEQ